MLVFLLSSCGFANVKYGEGFNDDFRRATVFCKSSGLMRMRYGWEAPPSVTCYDGSTTKISDLYLDTK